MRIRDWISDVCSSDLACRFGHDRVTHLVLEPGIGVNDVPARHVYRLSSNQQALSGQDPAAVARPIRTTNRSRKRTGDRKCVVKGKRVSVGVDLGGRRNHKKTHRLTIVKGHISK